MPEERFENRQTAGKQLAAILQNHSYDHPLVLGLAPGGTVVAAEVASALDAELGILAVRKLQAPFQSELSLGAVTAGGGAYIDSSLAEEVGAPKPYLETEKQRRIEQAKGHQAVLNSSRRHPIAERDVLLITDGVATGASAIAAVRELKAKGAKQVIIAAPVAAPDAITKLRQETDEVVCLLEASGFLSVSQFYDDFQTIDNQMIRRLLETSPQAHQP